MTSAARVGHRWRVSVTSAGWAVVVAVVVGNAAGAALGYPQLLVVAAAGLVALAGAAVLVLWRPHVTVERSFHPAAVVAGDKAVAVLAVTNTSRWRSPPLRAVDRLGQEDVALPVRSLGEGKSAMLHYPLPTERRARLALGPLAIVRTDPLALLEGRQQAAAGRTHDRHGEDVLWVHPKTWPMEALASGVVVDLEGPVSETAQTGSVTFASLREYVPGDDRRMIHWRSSARTGTLLVRHHVDTNEPRATIVLDARQTVWTAESFEHGVEVCASVAAAVGATGLKAELRIVGERPGRIRDLGAVTIADWLSAAEPTAETAPSALLRTLDTGPEGGALVVVTGHLEPGLDVRLAAQRRRHSPVVLCQVGAAGPSAGWRVRSGVVMVYGPTASALARAWNRMVHA